MLCLDLLDYEPQIAAKKYIAPIHLVEWSTAFLFMEIIIYNYAFSKDPQSILHTIPPLVVETTCALEVFPLFSELVYPTSNFDMGFL
jgi:hypothetical protein